MQAALNQLAATPGHAWLKDLHLRYDVQWQKMMDAYHRWDHQSKHLNPLMAVIITIGVAPATSGSWLAANIKRAAGGGVAGGAFVGADLTGDGGVS